MTMDAQSPGQDGDRLDSWKKIAAYLGKDVRTALRWSKDGGMPVHRHAGSKRGAVYAYRSEIDEWLHSDLSEPPPLYQNPAFVRIIGVLILVTAAAILFWWLDPITDQANTPANERTWVLITDFDNRSGEARFDGTLETALRRELANSRQVLVVAPERIRDTLALMKRSPETTIDATLGREICIRFGGNCALLTGRVEKFDSTYLLSLEVVDPADGRTVASATEEAAGEAGVLPAVRSLADWLRQYSGEELVHIELEDEQLEQVTTPSLRALELYSSGMQLMYLYRWVEAEALFRQAVEEDSEFASANLLAFWALNNQMKGYGEEAQSFLRRAMELAGSASEQERYFIEGTYYGLAQGNHEEACRSYKTLAELFPDHYWAAGNAVGACGEILGHREEHVRYIVQAAELRLDSILGAAQALTLISKDFDRARPYVKQLKDVIADGGVPGWKSMRAPISFIEFFSAEEILDQGLLPDVERELQRLELSLESRDAALRERMAFKLVNFYLALGQFQKARSLGHEELLVSALPAWLSFLEGDEAVFWEKVDNYQAATREIWTDRPTARLLFLLRMNMLSLPHEFPLDVLVPLYEPDTAVQTASAPRTPPLNFLDWPKFEAKLQLARGKQLLNQGRVDEAIPALRSGVRWLRDYGDWATFSYYFLGSEFLAATLADQGEVLAAYSWLEQAGEHRKLINSYTAPLHQRIQAQRALLARKLGRIAEAEEVEDELLTTLVLADPDHPVLTQIREQRGEFSGIE